MIISAYSPTLRKFGAIDDQTRQILIPYEYSDLEVQPHGIVVTNSSGNFGCFTLDGRIVYSPESQSKITNIIFLEDDMLLFTIPEKNRVAIVSFTGKFVIPLDYDAILFFCGINFQASEYSVSNDITNTLVDSFFYTSGASLSSRICVRSNDLWGVFEPTLQKLIVPCKFPRASQYKDNSIMLYDSKGNKNRI